MPARKKGTTRVRRKTQKGRGVMDVLKKIHGFVKSNKLISRGLRLTPYSGAANAAAMLGYGRGLKRTHKPLIMSYGAGRRKKGTTRVRRRRTVASLLGIPSLSKRTRRTRRSNPIKMHSRVVMGKAPSGSTLARRALGGQMGGGIFSDIGGGLGSIAHGIFG